MYKGRRLAVVCSKFSPGQPRLRHVYGNGASAPSCASNNIDDRAKCGPPWFRERGVESRSIAHHRYNMLSPHWSPSSSSWCFVFCLTESRRENELAAERGGGRKEWSNARLQADRTRLNLPETRRCWFKPSSVSLASLLDF
jgi:hypothetical protein